MLIWRVRNRFCIAFLVVILISFMVPVGLGEAVPQTIEVTIYSSKVIGVNNFSLGFQLDTPDIITWGDRPALRELARDANFKLVRLFDFRRTTPRLMPCTYWNESTRTGKWDWTYVDALVKKIFEIGGEPLICLGNGRTDIQYYIPRGMAVNPNTGLPYPGSYAAYAKEWVRHFKALGLPVRYYEILNEPLFYFGWSPSPKLRYFMDLWNTVARAMRSENPNILLSNDAVKMRMVFDYWLTQGDDVDYLDFHKYDAETVGQYTDASMFYLAERIGFENFGSFYGVSEARQRWFNIRGKLLPVINSESNFNSAWEGGTDPKIQQMTGAVWLALVLRKAVLKGLSYSVYFHFASSAYEGGSTPSRGFGFGMVNLDTNKPWYPYYVQWMIGQNLAEQDKLFETVSSSEDVRSLAWLHDGKLTILLVCKRDDLRNVSLQGVTGQLNYFKIDNTTSWKTPSVQTGTLNSTDIIVMKGYTVMLLQASTPEQPSSSGFLLEENFDSADFGKWNGTRTSLGENATVVNILPYEGSFHGRFTTNGGGKAEYAYCYTTMDEEEVYARGYFYIASGLPFENNDDRFYFIRFRAGENYLAGVSVRRNEGVDRWVLYGRNGSGWVGPVYAIATAVEIKRWYCVELHWKKHTTHGIVEAYVDGERLLVAENIDTAGFGNVSEISFGLVPALQVQKSLDVYVDCVAVSNMHVGPYRLGDINHDGYINIIDLSIVARSMWSTPNHPLWNPNSDLNKDGIINILDLAIVARNFGS